VNRAKLADVAARAGVSRSTASRALTGNGYAAPDVRERVRQVAEELGYIPDANARSLKARSTPTVGLLVSDLRNPFYAELAAGAGSVLRKHGYTIVLVDDAGSDVEELAAARTFLAMRVAGVLLTPVSADTTRFVLGQGVPVIEVDRQFCRGECDAVLVDNVAASRALAEHLLGLGHRRITLVIDETVWTTGAGRLKGFRQAMESAGVPMRDESVLLCGFDAVAASEAVAQVLSAGARARPTAIFAANNLIAEVVWRQINARGLRIPEDISFVAFDDAPWMSMVEPGVTTVAQPAFELGARAAQLLLSRVTSPGRPRASKVGTTLMERGSTRRVRSGVRR
jgi:LacI family transcriptional regulator